MTERERLTEILSKIIYLNRERGVKVHLATQVSEFGLKQVVDALLDNGVIVPPCKVGDTVYTVVFRSEYIQSSKVVGFHLGKFPTLNGQKRKEYLICYSMCYLRHVDIAQIGKTVFFTREEAEKALAERSNR